MQKITIIGRLGRDAAVRETQNGRKVIAFTVAVNGRVNGVEKTSWYDVSCFNYERYQNMVQYFTKGSAITVVGDLDADIEKGNDGVIRCRRNVLADSIDFAFSGTSGSTQNNGTKTTETSGATNSAEEEDMPRTKPSKKVKAEPEPTTAPGKEEDEDLPF